jgi:alkylresorcinol/alkylpyrone synthase/polyketide synthase Type III
MALKDYKKTNTKQRFMKKIAGNVYPKIISIGTANPPNKYTQLEVIELFGTKNPIIKRLFRKSHIKHRFLYLPEPGEDGIIHNETNNELIVKHLKGCIELGTLATTKCLSRLDIDVSHIDHIVCTTSTGLLLPAVSAHLVKALNLTKDTKRLDLVGMGCCAGMNSLQCATSLAIANPGNNVLLVCVEICSASYVSYDTIETAVVNSLFGDGGAAVLISTDKGSHYKNRVKVIGFESRTFVDHIDALKYDLFENDENKLSLVLSKELPYIIGFNIEDIVYGLLNKYGLKKRDISHWVIHAGGRKVLDSIKYNLGLTNHDIRHTMDVHEFYGNMSSCCVIFTLDALQKEGVVKKGDLGVMIAMGPGMAIETGLVVW